VRITRLDVWQVNLRLSEPYTIAYETVDSAVNVFVRLHTDSSFVGQGCAAPDRAVTGETPDSVAAALENVVRPMVTKMDPTRPAAIYPLLRQALGHQPSVLAAVDMAVWDILGKTANLPLWKLLGGSKEAIRTSITIGILPEKETVADARRWVAQGFTFLKLKGGRDVADDIARVRKVREAVGNGVDIAFDANQGYSLDQAQTFLRETNSTTLAFLEQPTPRGDPGLLGEVQRNTMVPVMADESLRTEAESFQLASHRWVKLFNIKLMKVGGLSAAMPIEGVAESAGIGAMVGCLDESALAIAAGLHFALGRPQVGYADLDSHFALLDDPAAAAVRCRDGWLYPTDRPGLGFDLD
jgi:L-alanine-DL-glutamate epimerase-like enolase superfamily enzyme